MAKSDESNATTQPRHLTPVTMGFNGMPVDLDFTTKPEVVPAELTYEPGPGILPPDTEAAMQAADGDDGGQQTGELLPPPSDENSQSSDDDNGGMIDLTGTSSKGRGKGGKKG